MGTRGGRKGGVVRIRPDLGRRLKVVASMEGSTIEAVISAVVEKEIAAVEKAAKSRFRATTRPDKGPPVD
jgi:hypothetical protein